MEEGSSPTEERKDPPTAVTLDDQTLAKVIDGVAAKLKECQRKDKSESVAGTSSGTGKFNSKELPFPGPTPPS